MRVRSRAIGGAVLAIALVVAVALLRGQVEPPEPDPTAQPLTATPSPRALPFRPAERVSRWRTYELPAGTVTAWVDPEHVVSANRTEYASRRPAGTLTVRSRDGSGLETGYRPQPAGWEPASWQILDGALFVVEVAVDGAGGPPNRLMRVELGSGRAEEVLVRSVQFVPSLLTAGDELVVTGISLKNPVEGCAVAIRPSTGGERTIICGIVLPSIEPADGGVLIKLPDNSPNGCSVRLLVPGRGEFGLPVFIGYCRQRQIIPLDGWQASYLDGSESAQPLLATDGTDHVRLGTAKAAVVSCHGRLYWVSGGRKDSPYGIEVLRWRPGAGEVEVVQRSRGETEFGWPTCVKGTLSVPVYGSAADRSVLTDLMVLDRP